MRLGFPEMDRKQRRLLIVLALALCYLAYDLMANWEDYQRVYRGVRDEPEIVSEPPAYSSTRREGNDASGLLQQYDGRWRNDPFQMTRPVRQTPQVRRNTAPTLKLTGISGGKHPVALINGKLLMVGESVAGYRLEEIHNERVILIRNGERRVLELK